MGITVSSREAATAAQKPTLTVVTDVNTYILTPSSDSYMDPATTNCIGTSASLKPPFILKFDLSGVQGATAASGHRLDLNGLAADNAPFTLALNYLNMPALVTDPENEIGSVVAGLRGTVAESSLSAHPSVVFYCAPTLAEVQSKFTNLPADINGARHVFGTSSELGVNTVTIGTATLSGTIADWKKVFATGYTELYLAITIKIKSDVKTGFSTTETGVKLPGLGNSLVFSSKTMFSTRLQHRGPSASNPGVFRLATAFFDGTTPRNGTNTARTVATDTCIPEDKYRTYQWRVKLNDPGVSNGIIQNRVDGALVYSDTAANVRGSDSTLLIDMIEMSLLAEAGNFASDVHYEIGPIVGATQEIGKIKKGTVGTGAYPAWRQGKTTNTLYEIPNTALANGTGFPGNPLVMLDRYDGCAYNDTTGDFYVGPGGGHALPGWPWGLIGRCRLDVDNPGPYTNIAPVTPLSETAPYEQQASRSIDFRGRPSANHTYYNFQYIPQRDKLFLFRSMNVYGAQAGSTRSVFSFDLTTLDWDFRGTWSGTLADFQKIQGGGSTYTAAVGNWQSFPSLLGIDIGTCCVNPLTGNVYASAYGAPHYGSAIWTQSTAIWQVYSDDNISGFMGNQGTCWDTVRNRVFCVPGASEGTAASRTATIRNITGIGYNTNFSTLTITGLGSEPMFSNVGSGGSGCCYDSDNDKYIIMSNSTSGAGRIYEIDPDTGAGTVLHATNQTIAEGGVLGKLHYSPKFRCVLYHGRSVENIRFMPR